MNNNSNKFFDGFLLGLLIGGAAVFLFGTKSGKNLLKIISEQGLEGISDLMEQYSEDYDEEDLDTEGPIAEENAKSSYAKAPASQRGESEGQGEAHSEEYTSEKPPKKRFFKRFRN
ncbi:MAG: hypothetical protein COU25_02500 [Candidatus Levybacteria bacterium CG10_big_fil_rev_8_21_14_0_10_35_13]|nr:MAG: hypothetical protein COU25_02500 [Candidatus Levybacteria bacterium CG10_big_fil_rev_8_21_14_0_10_35_13]